MSTWIWILIAAGVAVIAIAIVWSLAKARRTKSLQEGFGPEYDRVAADAPSTREAESELLERRKRHEQFDIRPLSDEQQHDYSDRWMDVQASFVDEPEKSIARADSLIQEVMRERGYPVDDFETRAADLSVEHPDVVENYRAAHGIRTAHERGKATTDDLRKAVQHYRALFLELVEVGEPQEARR
jgi:hypothetical protein